MKKTFGFATLFALIFAASTAFAQTNAPAATPATAAAPSSAGIFNTGRMMVGGTISYSSDTVSYDVDGMDDDELSTLRFAPFFGYFIMPNLAIIGQLTYQSQDNGGPDDTVTIGLAVGARYYYPVADKINLYGGGMLGYQSVDYGSMDMSGFGINLHGGALYMLGPNWGVDAGLMIQYYMGSADAGGNSVDISMTSFAIGYFGMQAFF